MIGSIAFWLCRVFCVVCSLSLSLKRRRVVLTIFHIGWMDWKTGAGGAADCIQIYYGKRRVFELEREKTTRISYPVNWILIFFFFSIKNTLLLLPLCLCVSTAGALTCLQVSQAGGLGRKSLFLVFFWDVLVFVVVFVVSAQKAHHNNIRELVLGWCKLDGWWSNKKT